MQLLEFPFWMSVAFIAGYYTAGWASKFYVEQSKKNELYEEYLRKQKECPHGYENWSDCPQGCGR